MRKTIFSALMIVAAGVAHAGGHGASTFQNSCSQIEFAYSGNDATIQAVCLRANGTAVPASTAIMGIANLEGVLTMTGGASSFQQSCGNISLEIQSDGVSLIANCRKSNGDIRPSAIELNGINNTDGVLNSNM